MSATAITPDDLIPTRSDDPSSARILARRYVRPANAGLIIIPESYRVDHGTSLWEPVKWHPDAEAWLGETLHTSDVLVSKPFAGSFCGRLGTREDYFFLRAEEILARIPDSEAQDLHQDKS